MTQLRELAPRHRTVPGSKLVAPLSTAALALSATAYVAAVAPGETGHYPACPFWYVTGYYCPGCGSLRAVHDLAHGDVPAALAHNPLTVLAAPYLLWAWITWVRRTLTGKPERYMAPPWVLWTLLAVIMAFWVLRNVPGFEFLAP